MAKRTRSAAAAPVAGPGAAAGSGSAPQPPPAPVGVTFSTKDSAQQLGYSKGGLEVTGAVGGYRMARATDGVFSGNWYWEAEVLLEEEEEEGEGEGAEGQLQLQEGQERPADGQSGEAPTAMMAGAGNAEEADGSSAPHFRLGWALRQADTQAFCGYDKNSYGYRDVDGAKVHKSLREDGYGEPYGAHARIGRSWRSSEGSIRLGCLTVPTRIRTHKPKTTGPGDVIGFGICLPILPEHMQELSALNGGVLPAYVRGAGGA